jgi:hypothetical protein
MGCGVVSCSRLKEFLNVILYMVAVTTPYHSYSTPQIR